MHGGTVGLGLVVAAEGPGHAGQVEVDGTLVGLARPAQLAGERQGPLVAPLGDVELAGLGGHGAGGRQGEEPALAGGHPGEVVAPDELDVGPGQLRAVGLGVDGREPGAPEDHLRLIGDQTDDGVLELRQPALVEAQPVELRRHHDDALLAVLLAVRRGGRDGRLGLGEPAPEEVDGGVLEHRPPGHGRLPQAFDQEVGGGPIGVGRRAITPGQVHDGPEEQALAEQRVVVTRGQLDELVLLGQRLVEPDSRREVSNQLTQFSARTSRNTSGSPTRRAIASASSANACRRS